MPDHVRLRCDPVIVAGAPRIARPRHPMMNRDVSTGVGHAFG